MNYLRTYMHNMKTNSSTVHTTTTMQKPFHRCDNNVSCIQERCMNCYTHIRADSAVNHQENTHHPRHPIGVCIKYLCKSFSRKHIPSRFSYLFMFQQMKAMASIIWWFRNVGMFQQNLNHRITCTKLNRGKLVYDHCGYLMMVSL